MRVVAAVVLAVLAFTSDVRAEEFQRAIPAIENDLVTDDPTIRARRALELVGRFPDGAVAVPMLVDLLDDESPEVVQAAAKAIDALAVAGAKSLADWCRDDKRFRAAMPGEPDREFAGWLEAEGCKHTRALDLFVNFLKSRLNTAAADAACVTAALVTFDDLRDPMTCLASTARRSEGDSRTIAAAALAMLGSDALAARGPAPDGNDARAVSAAAAIALVNDDLDVKAWFGIRLLARLRSSDRATLDALTRGLLAKKALIETGHRRLAPTAACRALAALGPPAARAAEALLAELADPDAHEELRAECARALALCGCESHVRDGLAGAGEFSAYLAQAVAMEGRMAETVAPLLIAALGEPKPTNSSVLVYAKPLASLGPSAVSALPLLKRMIAATQFRSEALACLDAVLAIAPDDTWAISRLLSVLEDPSLQEEDAREAMRILAARAPVTSAVLAKWRQTVTAAAESKPTIGWLDAVDGLGRAGPAAKSSVSTLLRLLDQLNKKQASAVLLPFESDDRRRLAIALGRIGPGAADAVPALTELRDKGDETIRVVAAQARRRIQTKK